MSMPLRQAKLKEFAEEILDLENRFLDSSAMGNLLVVVLLTIVFGFVLIFFIQKTAKARETDEEKIPIAPNLKKLDLDSFFELSCEMLEKMGLRVLDSYRSEDNAIDIYLENPQPIVGGPLIAHLILYPPGAQVTSTDVQNFASDIVAERRGKGILITTGFFAPDVATLPELPPMELIDGKRLSQLMDTYQVEVKNNEK